MPDLNAYWTGTTPTTGGLMSDLVTWLSAQLDEDEQVARAASGDNWVRGFSMGYAFSQEGDVYAIAPDGTPARIAQGTRCGPDISAEQSSEHIARHNPARVLAEVEAKRRILADCAAAEVDRSEVAKLLALPYAAQPGYRNEWRPSR